MKPLNRILLFVSIIGILVIFAVASSASPTPVNFTATDQSDGVSVTWETTTGYDFLAFVVLRSLQYEGPYMDISEPIDAMDGDAVGALYHFEDNEVVVGTTYYYQLRVTTQSQGDQWEQVVGPVWATHGVIYTPTPRKTATATATQTPTGPMPTIHPPNGNYIYLPMIGK